MLYLQSAGLSAPSTLNLSLTAYGDTVYALPRVTNENPKSKMMESVAQTHSAIKWPAQVYTQLLTNCRDLAWSFYIQGSRGREALPGV